MTGTMVIYLACGPGHPVSVALRVVEVVGVLLPVAGLVSLITGLWQRSAAAKQPSRPFQGYPARRPPQANYPRSAPPGHPQQWAGGHLPGRPPRPKPKGTTFIMVGVALPVLGLLCFLFLWLLAC
jgi:hypothetical protein